MHSIERIILLAAAAVISAACTKEYAPSASGESSAKVFTAYFADTAPKAYIDNSNGLHWTEGDRISVFGGVTNERYVFDGITGDNGGTFSKDGGSAVTPTWSRYFAIYPYSASTKAGSEGTFTCTIPETQQYVPESFDPEAALMVARTDDLNSTDIKFRHACAFLKVRVYSKTNAVLRKLYLTGNSYECLSGTGTLTLDAEGIPGLELSADFDSSIGGASEGYTGEEGTVWDTKTTIGGSTDGFSGGEPGGSRRIVLDCGEEGVKVGTSAETATVFVFALAPGTFPNGFKITTVDKMGGQYTKSTHNAVTLSRASVSAMAPYELTMAGGGLDITSFSLVTPSHTKYTASTIGNSTVSLLIPESVDKSALTAEFTTTGREVYVGDVKQESGVTVNDFSAAPVKYTVKNVNGDSRDYTINIQAAPKLIACWGDSFTNSFNPYPPILQTLLGETWEVYDGGIGGDRSNEIAARQGAIKTVVRTIGSQSMLWPITTASLGISSVCTDDPYLDPDTSYKFRPDRWTSSTRGLNPCTVAGVECTLAYNSLTRKITGTEEVVLEDKSEITTYGASHCKDADVIVIYIGTNGGWNSAKKDYDLLMAQHWAMINFTTQKKYIVLASHISSVHGSSKWYYAFRGGDDKTYLERLGKEFGNHVIYLHREITENGEDWLVKSGAYKSKSEISPTDKEYLARGEWPLSFFVAADDEHPSKYGSTAMAMLIKEKMIELGYLDD